MASTVPSKPDVRDYWMKCKNFMTNFMSEIKGGVNTGTSVSLGMVLMRFCVPKIHPKNASTKKTF